MPLVVRWPGVIKPGTEINEIVSHEDWLPTLLAAAGQPNVVESALTGLTAGGVTYKVHLDGYNLLPYFKGETKEWPRRDFVYWTDDGDPAGLRFEQWKIVFLEQRAESFEVWQDPMRSTLSGPLRMASVCFACCTASSPALDTMLPFF